MPGRSRAAGRASLAQPRDPLHDVLVQYAAAAGPPGLRLLDAIHLATALSIDDPALDIVTYHCRFAEAASASGLRVVQPGV